MSVVKIDDVVEGQEVFIPGVGREARVIQLIMHHQHNQGVVVILSDGREVTYSRKTWYAIDVNSIPNRKKNQGVVVGTDKVRRPIQIAQTKRQRKEISRPGKVTIPTKPSNRIPGNREKPVPPIDWPTSQPKIPGPPVPKPSDGIWTDEIKGWFSND